MSHEKLLTACWALRLCDLLLDYSPLFLLRFDNLLNPEATLNNTVNHSSAIQKSPHVIDAPVFTDPSIARLKIVDVIISAFASPLASTRWRAEEED